VDVLPAQPGRQLNLRLAPGDCLVFDNTRVLHPRTAFSMSPGPAVTEPVRLHVAAKRYLCATEPGYLGLLSAESVRTLALQGGPMTPDQAAEFGALPYARDAVAVRRWDDGAKDPSLTPPAFGHFEALLRALLKRGPLSS
jgi:predicted HD phosphohydrolase